MKRIVKVMTLVLSVVMLTSLFSGCFKPDDGPDVIDETKTQLYIGNVNQGFGDAWLRQGVKPRFEEMYKDVKFEDGKNGVQLIIRDTDYGSSLISTIAGNRDEVFFSESVSYYQFVNCFIELTAMPNLK